MADQFSINNNFDFTTLSPSVLGGSYKMMKVTGMLTAAEAVKYRDIHTIHNQLKPFIAGLPVNATDGTYILFKTKDDVSVLLGLDWIDQTTINRVTTTNIRIEVMDGTNLDIGILRSAILGLGYTNINISTF